MSRLLLFDIDGTILNTGGAAKRAFHRALLEVYGTAGPIEDHDFAGKTDPQIARELLRRAGVAESRIDDGLPTLFAAYVAELRLEIESPHYAPIVHPGVPELLDALEAHRADPLLGLLTGNVAEGAELKVGSVGLRGRFRLGAYGSDSEHRAELPRLAVERARALTGRSYRGREVVVIGDTPHDVTCGRSIGVLAVGVATGSHTAEELAAAGAHLVLENLADTAGVVDALLGSEASARRGGPPEWVVA